jgi:hypothetical protein
VSKAWTIAATAALLATAAPAFGGDFSASGDGSATNNVDLLQTPGAPCANCGPMPSELDTFPFDLDWSLGLRGGLISSSDGTSVEFLALPEVRLTQETLRGGYSAGLSGELSYEVDGEARINSVTVDGNYDYRFDAVTTGGLRGSFTLSQDAPDADDTLTNVAAAPIVGSGFVEASVKRELAYIDLELRGSAGRTVYGDTRFNDDTTVSNEFQNVSSLAAGGRAGVKLTPGLTAFVDGQATQETYDAEAPSLAVKLDNVTYAGRAGLNAKFLDTLELEGSLGLAYRDFADASLGDFSAVLYDARAIYRPDETVSLTGAFTTTVGSPGTTSGATSKVTYAATGEAAYLVNPWLRLRASAGWSEAHYQGIDTDEYKWNAGVGADYLLNENVDITADYVASRRTTTPALPKDEHQVLLGVNIHR